MKKFSLLVLTLCLCVLAVGCGKDNKKKEEKPKDVARIEETIKDLYTDEEKLVYKNGDLYKLVFYFEGEEITGLEHYYEYKDEAEADKKYKEDTEKYKNNIQIKKITKSGKFVVYTMAGSEYEGKTVKEVKDSYSFLLPVYEK